MAAPIGNRNRTTWGGRGWAAVGSYPKGCSHVRRYVGRMRVELEEAVCAMAGGLNAYQAALIQSACRHEGRALLLTRWMRVEPDLKLNDRLAVLREIGSATDSRDKCLQKLGLATPPSADPWAAVDSLLAGTEAAPGKLLTEETADGEKAAAAGAKEALSAGLGDAMETRATEVPPRSPGQG